MSHSEPYVNLGETIGNHMSHLGGTTQNCMCHLGGTKWNHMYNLGGTKWNHMSHLGGTIVIRNHVRNRRWDRTELLFCKMLIKNPQTMQCCGILWPHWNSKQLPTKQYIETVATQIQGRLVAW